MLREASISTCNPSRIQYIYSYRIGNSPIIHRKVFFMNRQFLLASVAEYRTAQKAFSQKWGTSGTKGSINIFDILNCLDYGVNTIREASAEIGCDYVSARLVMWNAVALGLVIPNGRLITGLRGKPSEQYKITKKGVRFMLDFLTLPENPVKMQQEDPATVAFRRRKLSAK